MVRLLVGLFWVGTSAAAAPRVALHPFTFSDGAPKDRDALTEVFLSEASRQKVEWVSSVEVRDVVQGLSSAGCASSGPCLSQLAQKTGAAYAARVSVTGNGPSWVFAAVVVRADGEEVKRVDALAVPKSPKLSRSDGLNAALKKLFSALKLDALPDWTPAVPALAQAEPVASAPRPAALVPTAALEPTPTALTAPVPEPQNAKAGLRIAAWSVGGASIGVGILGAVMRTMAGYDAERLAVLPNGAISAADIPLAQGIDTKNAVAVTAFTAAGAGLVTAAVLYIVSRGETP